MYGNYTANRINEYDITLDGSIAMEGSLANYGHSSTPSLLQPWLHVISMCLLLLFHQYLAQQHRRFCRQMDKNVITPSDYACEFSNLPPNTVNDAEFQSFVESLMQGAKVASINFAYDIREYAKIEEREKELRNQYNKLKYISEKTGVLPRQKLLKVLPGPRYSLETVKSQLDQANLTLQQLKNTHKNHFAGTAFIVFEQDESTPYLVAKLIALQYGKRELTARERLKKSFCWCVYRNLEEQRVTYQGGSVSVKRAPEPDDIIWANLGVRGR